MFAFRRALRSALAAHPDDELVNLDTPWGATLDPANVLQEYPRPHLQRESYINLNGWWDYALTGNNVEMQGFPAQPDGRILVPFSPEAKLSGVNRQLQPDQLLWYRRSFNTPPLMDGEHCLLHFEAVDHAANIYVNERLCERHEGGYLPFCLDVTDALHAPGAPNQVVVCVSDPSDAGTQPRGKQKLARGTIWYTAQSGIWQTVWMEVVPAAHVLQLDLHANPDTGLLRATLTLTCGNAPLYVTVSAGNDEVAHGCAPAPSTDLIAKHDGAPAGTRTVTLTLKVKAPHLWCPDDPFIYHVSIDYGDDHVSSYCAFRTFSIETDASGTSRFCCNHEPLFLRGLLDQGYWSDGLLTAPSDEALVHDIETARKLGFNMLRKHIKVESERWYYHCDRLGMVVWQDMVSGGGAYRETYTSRIPTLLPGLCGRLRDTGSYERFGSGSPSYRDGWVESALDTVRHLRNHPCIATWTVFNEGWGQFDAQRVTDLVRATDPTRPIDQASGWYRQGGGDYVSVHNYFRTLKVPRTPRGQASIISEFGGVALRLPGHSAIDRAYGYQNCTTLDDFQTQVRELIAKADTLEGKGLSGYVYTQLSDVEEEVNGLLSYDRRVCKLDASE